MRPFLTPNESLSTFTTGARQFVVHLRAREFDLYGRARVKLRPILPSSLGLRLSLQGRKLGYPVDRWFSFGSTFTDYGHYRLATNAFMNAANLLGVRSSLTPPTCRKMIFHRLAGILRGGARRAAPRW